MLVNNFKKYIYNAFQTTKMQNADLISISGVSSSESTYNVAFPTTEIATRNYTGGNSSGNQSSLNFSCKYLSLTFGGGSSATTAGDYQMEVPYDTTNHFEWVSQTISFTGFSIVITASIKNISENSLSISEIGVVCGTSTSFSNFNLLISRDVISPVVLEPQEIKSFTYTINFDEMVG